MKLSLIGRVSMALFASLALGLGMTACGGGTIGYMWVLGQQYNQISGFKIDDFTGNLTQIPHAPFVSNGAVPVSIVVKPGGRYVFVLNQGTGGGLVTAGGVTTFSKGVSSGVAVFSVGGDGVLTFQQNYQSQGYVPQWLQLDNTGQYLFVLDKYSPSATVAGCQLAQLSSACNGSLTVFSIDGSTGRLTLIQNTQTPSGTAQPTYFDVGPSPFVMKTAGGCLLTVNGNNTISPYSFGGSGQLTISAGTGTYPTLTTSVSSINAGGSYIYLTDRASNQIFSYTLGASCVLSPVSTGVTKNLPGTSFPNYVFSDSSNKYLYVLNNNSPSVVTQAASSISAFTVNPGNGQLAPITDSPYTTGSNPVCMVEDPTNQYMYISNRFDGTVTGKVLDPTTGRLSDLSRGATFPASGTGNCLALSGAVN